MKSRWFRNLVYLCSGHLGIVLFTGCTSTGLSGMTGRALVEIDESFAAAAAKGDIDAIMGHWTDHAVMYAPNLPPLQGKQAIRELIERRRSIPGYSISWTPRCAGMGEHGTMAYTLGEGTVTLPDESGTLRQLDGRYVAIWHDDGDRWRCAVKCWTPSAPGDDSATRASPNIGY